MIKMHFVFTCFFASLNNILKEEFMLNIKKIIRGLFIIITSCIYIVSIKASTTIDETSELKSINVTKNITNVTSNVDVTFNYLISEVRDENPEGITGINENFSITFNNIEPQNNIASVTKSLDLSSLTFSKVGDYYLKICEVSSSNESIYPIDNKCFYPLVMVRNELINNMPTGNLIATLLSSVSDGENKTDAVFTTRPMSYITLNNKVTGDMSDKDEYFKFKITINDNNLENVVIKNQDAIVTYEGEEIITSSTYNSDVDNFIYLKHNQSVTIGNSDNNQIPSGLSYTIEELDKENYQTYINDSIDDNKILEVTSLSNNENDNINNFVNNYERITFTGVVADVAPYLILVLIAIILFVLTRKKYDEE
jgi:hypothetical protein